MNDDMTAAIIIYLFTEEQQQLRLSHNELMERLKRILEIIQIIRQIQKGT